MSKIVTLTDLQKRVVTEEQYNKDLKEANEISIKLAKDLLKAKHEKVKDKLYIQLLTDKHKEALERLKQLEQKEKINVVEIKHDTSVIRKLIDELAKDPDISKDVINQYNELNEKEYKKMFC